MLRYSKRGDRYSWKYTDFYGGQSLFEQYVPWAGTVEEIIQASAASGKGNWRRAWAALEALEPWRRQCDEEGGTLAAAHRDTRGQACRGGGRLVADAGGLHARSRAAASAQRRLSGDGCRCAAR